MYMLSLMWEQVSQKREQQKKLDAFKCVLYTILCERIQFFSSSC